MRNIEIQTDSALLTHASVPNTIFQGRNGPEINLTPITERGIGQEISIGLDTFLYAAFDSLAFRRALDIENIESGDVIFKSDYIFSVLTELIKMDILRGLSHQPYWFFNSKDIYTRIRNKYDDETKTLLYSENTLLKRIGRARRNETLEVPDFNLDAALQKYMHEYYDNDQNLAKLIFIMALSRRFGRDKVSKIRKNNNDTVYQFQDAEISYNQREINLQIKKVENYDPYKYISIRSYSKCKVGISETPSIEALITESEVTFDSLKSLLEFCNSNNLQNSGVKILQFVEINHVHYSLKQVNPCVSIEFKIPEQGNNDRNVHEVYLYVPDINLLTSAELSKYQQFTTKITPHQQ